MVSRLPQNATKYNGGIEMDYDQLTVKMNNFNSWHPEIAPDTRRILRKATKLIKEMTVGKHFFMSVNSHGSYNCCD